METHESSRLGVRMDRSARLRRRHAVQRRVSQVEWRVGSRVEFLWAQNPFGPCYNNGLNMMVAGVMCERNALGSARRVQVVKVGVRVVMFAVCAEIGTALLGDQRRASCCRRERLRSVALTSSEGTAAATHSAAADSDARGLCLWRPRCASTRAEARGLLLRPSVVVFWKEKRVVWVGVEEWWKRESGRQAFLRPSGCWCRCLWPRAGPWPLKEPLQIITATPTRNT
jgi:hypothetical protein